MCKPRITFYLLSRAGPPGMPFYISGLACLPSWLGMVNACRLSSNKHGKLLTLDIHYANTGHHRLFILFTPLLRIPHKWGNVFKNGQSKNCERQLLRDFTWFILGLIFRLEFLNEFFSLNAMRTTANLWQRNH